MFRARRYRVFIVFTAIFIVSFFYFARSRNADTVIIEPPKPPSPPPPPPAENKGAAPPPPPPPPHGFVPESPPFRVDGQAASESKPDSKSNSQDQSSKADKPPVEKPIHSFPAKPPSSDAGSKTPVEENKDTTPPQKKPDNQQLESGNGGEGRVEVSQPNTGKPSAHWKKLPEHFPVATEKLIKLPTGKSKTLPRLQAEFKDESISDRLQRLQRLSHVKEAFQHAWTGYKKSAMGHDEVAPVTGGHRDPFNGWGATLVDALDTLWMMDLREEFSIAVDEVKKIDFTTSLRKDIPLFETTIRYLGGLLGAYDISGHKYTVLLEKAIELADILMGAFDTPNRMPMLYYKWAPESVSQPHLADSKAVLAEIGSLSLEFTRLAQLTKENKYYDAIARITDELEKSQDSTRLPGLWPLRLDASGCRKSMESSPVIAREKSADSPTSSSIAAKHPAPTDVASYRKFLSRRDVGGLGEDAEPANYDEPLPGTADLKTDAMAPSDKNCKEGLISAGPGNHTFGLAALADSTYEYMPKEHMLLGGINEQYGKMYKKAMATTRKHLLFQPMVKDGRDLRFIASAIIPKGLAEQDREAWSYAYEGSHLACFAGGMFALGAKLFEIDGDMDIASKLADGCVWAYESTKTGIMPESFHLLPCDKSKPCLWNEAHYRKALDPQADMRVKQAEELYQQKLQFAKEAQNKVEGADKEAPAPPASFPAGSRQDAIDKHEAGDRRGKVTPMNGTRLTRREAAPLEKPVVLSHDDFVNARVRDERLPPGFVKIPSRYYLLRPEAIESVFIMYRLTGDEYWREKGWKMFEAVTRHTRTEHGHSAIFDVTAETPRFRNGMESFWLAETLKYFYLLFSDPSVVNLDEYVLNTEAHPLKRPEY